MQFALDSIRLLHDIESNPGLGSYRGTLREDRLANADR